MAKSLPQPDAKKPKIKPFAFIEWALLKAAMWDYDGTLIEISNRAYVASPDVVAPAIENGDPSELVCDLAKETYDDDLAIYAAVLDKTRTLLGICPLLITLFGLLLPRITHPCIGAIPIACFLAALLLLLANIGVSTRSTASIDNELIARRDNAVRRLVASSYYHAGHLNSHRTRYAVDVYKASVRYVGAGSFVLCALLVISLIWPPDQKPVAVQSATMPAPMFHVPSVVMPTPVFNVPPATAPAPIIYVLPASMPTPVVNVIVSPNGRIGTAPSTQPSGGTLRSPSNAPSP
jgi:hypothetical protein